MKTPALQEAMNPLTRLEITAKERHSDALIDHQAAEVIHGQNKKLVPFQYVLELSP